MPYRNGGGIAWVSGSLPSCPLLAGLHGGVLASRGGSSCFSHQ